MTLPRDSRRNRAESGSPIIKAYKHGWPRRWVHRMIENRTRAGMHAIQVQGLERLRSAIAAEPGGLLIVANHSSWWDFFMAHLLNEAIPVDGYGMTEHFNMKKFGFFRRIGAYSVDRTSPASVRASISYTAELLQGPRAAVWVFPQGKIICNDVRPLEFQPGLRLIIRKAGRIRIAAAALRYEYWQDERPEAFARFGEPIWTDCDAVPEGSILETWSRRLAAELDALKGDVLTQDPGRFTTILSGKESIHDRYARWTGKSRKT